RFLSRKYAGNRIVLIVVDGLALDQWKTIKEQMQQRNSSLRIHENAVFAWIPTLTSVSRQAVFSGKPPLYFASSINSTNNEESLWKNFWDNEHNIPQPNVVYRRNLKNENIPKTLDAILKPNSHIVGLVINIVDDIMHGMQLGTKGMHNQIMQWCSGDFLSTLIDNLLGRRYEIWLTADHGNIECKGAGRIAEGAIADTKGERARVYSTAELRFRASESFPDTLKWQQIGLPTDYFPLIANGRNAFINQGKSIVAHGGISIEEVIVPFIKFEKKNG
ncbi:BREX-3 system phosphatase PglZ, partial [Breznakiellaceae bacterium SP9]